MNGPFVASNRCSIITAVACQKVHWNSGSSRSTVQIAKVIYCMNSWRIPTRLIRWQNWQNRREIQSTPYFLQFFFISERFRRQHRNSKENSWRIPREFQSEKQSTSPFELHSQSELTGSCSVSLGVEATHSQWDIWTRIISDFQILYWFFSTTIRPSTCKDGSVSKEVKNQ